MGTASTLTSFVWDETFICLVLPFFTVEGKRGGVRGAVCGTVSSPLLSSLQY